VAGQLCEKLLKNGFTRSGIILGIGGGVITDLAGFVASIYLRGVRYIAVPTSLLAMVDAAIGGKTGVDLSAKNSVGTFYPAELVMIDTHFLKTLPKREMKCGMAEIIKYAATLDAGLIKVLTKKKLNLPLIINRSVVLKVQIVNQDLKEFGLRKVLNYGHTFGHAVEQFSNYQLNHGESISIGIILANQVARKLKKQSAKTEQQIKNLLQQYKLPTQLPKGIKKNDLTKFIRKDKKLKANKITFILSTGLGKYTMMEISIKDLIKLIN
jgi:3-dehydroquinate synthase